MNTQHQSSDIDDDVILNAAMEAMSLKPDDDTALPFDDLENMDVFLDAERLLQDFQIPVIGLNNIDTGDQETFSENKEIIQVREPLTPTSQIKQEADKNKLNQNIITEPVTPPDKITASIPSAGSVIKSEKGDLDAFYKEFQSKLDIKSQTDSTTKRALVILSPLSYKHIFSRWWIPRKYLSTIVERPQRLMACSLGIGTALAKFPDNFSVEVSSKRSSLLSDHVIKVHGANWAHRLYSLCEESKEKLENRKIEVPEDWNSGDIYLCRDTIDALEGVIGAVETAVGRLFSSSIDSIDRTFVTIRPPGHHSHPCAPSGFCIINNAHIAVQYAKKNYGVTHAVILDFDLHHGDGTQDICWSMAARQDPSAEEDIPNSDNNAKKSAYAPAPDSEDGNKDENAGSTKENDKPTKSETNDDDNDEEILEDTGIGYFSLHDINSFPTEVGYASAENIKNGSVCIMAHNMCIWNVHLEPYETDDEFYEAYDKSYSVLFEKAQQFLRKSRKIAKSAQKPFKAMVLFSAGFDASEYEGKGMQRHGVHVPTSFYNRFTRDGVKLANEYADGKVLSLLEGGYSDKALSTGIFSHMSGLADQLWDDKWMKPNHAKELEKGCKLRWNACGAAFRKEEPQTVDWLSKGIQLGRSLWPEDIRLQAASMNLSASTSRINRTGVFNNMDSVPATPSRKLRDRSKIQTPYRS